MANCHYTIDGKTYSAIEFDDYLRAMHPREAAKFMPSVKSLPPMPFEKSWAPLAMRRIIKFAVDNGFDRVAWSPGDVHADRYDISKQVSGIAFQPETGELYTRPVGGDEYTARPAAKGVTKANLADHVGKDVAETMLARDAQEGYHYAEGADLKIGGSGMRGFYDRILPAETQKIVGKFGAKVGKSEINVPNEWYGSESPDDTPEMRAAIAAEQPDRGELVHSFDITPQMRTIVGGEGLPLFARGQERTEGATPDTAAVQAMADAIHDVLGKKARIEIIDTDGGGLSIHMPDGTQFQADGYAVGRLIRVAMEGDKTLSHLRHEALHALRNMGVFTPHEWKLLEGAAKREGWIEKFGIAERYPDLVENPELMTEEAIADAFSHAAANPKEAGALLTRLWGKLRDFFERVRNWLGKRGFQTVDDVFGKIETGEVGRREPGSGMPERGPTDLGEAQREADVFHSVRFSRRPGAPPDATPSIVRSPMGYLRAVAPKSVVARQAVKALDYTQALGKGMQTAIAPMSTGGIKEQADAFNFANALRGVTYQYGLIDRYITKTFNPKEREAMGRAMDAQSVFEQTLARMDPDDRRVMEPHDRGEFDASGKGVAGLPEEQRKVVENLAGMAMQLWEEMRSRGMVHENANGLPYYFARQMLMQDENGNFSRPQSTGGGTSRAIPKDINDIASNVRTNGPMRRKHLTPEETEAAAQTVLGENAVLLRDIRSVVQRLATNARSIAGRDLIDAIKGLGNVAGDEPWVVAGAIPSSLSKDDYFTINRHPAFWENTPNGSQPIWVRKEYKGPLEAVLKTETGALFREFMRAKSVSMSMIMYSPFMHLGVEMGRAFPLVPGKIITGRFMRDGAILRADRDFMKQAVEHGVAPIGQSWTLDPVQIAEEAARINPKTLIGKGFDAIKDIHQRMLWDNVLNLQMVIYKEMMDRFVKMGRDPEVSGIMAAHLANRFAGALPPENLSKLANQLAHIMLFSRSYTLGNMGVMKDAFTGASSHVLAKIEYEHGADARTQSVKDLKSIARKTVFWDIALSLGLTALIQMAFSAANDAIDNNLDWMSPSMGMAGGAAAGFLVGGKKGAAFGALAGGTLGAAYAGWGRKPFEQWFEETKGKLSNVHENPLNVFSVFPQHHNEPGKRDRAMMGTDAQGRGVYLRSPAGKVGEEFLGWWLNPMQLFLNKLSPFVRPLTEVAFGETTIGQKLWRPNPEGAMDYAANAGRAIQHFVEGQGPLGALLAHPVNAATGAKDLVTGANGTGRTALQVVKGALPILGLGSVSVGNPGGPEAGEDRAYQNRTRFDIQEARPEARRLMQQGKEDQAREVLEKAGMSPRDINFEIRRFNNPAMIGRSLRKWRNQHGGQEASP